MNGVNGVNGRATGDLDAATPYANEAEPDNPTVVPTEMLSQFHFAFLIRNPHSSIPSYFRCTIPPLEKMTGWHNFDPSEAGYDEVRRVFDYLCHIGQVGPERAKGSANIANSNGVNGKKEGGVEICVVDADDLLDDPDGIIRAFCESVGLEYDHEMLNWDNEKDQEYAKRTFEKWKGFHEDAIDSQDLKPRTHVRSLFSLH